VLSTLIYIYIYFILLLITLFVYNILLVFLLTVDALKAYIYLFIVWSLKVEYQAEKVQFNTSEILMTSPPFNGEIF